MKPKPKEFEKAVTIHHTWEEINGDHILVNPKVSAYIRELEEKVADLHTENLDLRTEMYHLNGVIKKLSNTF
jgi:hypothetical protein